jgi:hypothetical protein
MLLSRHVEYANGYVLVRHYAQNPAVAVSPTSNIEVPVISRSTSEDTMDITTVRAAAVERIAIIRIVAFKI